MFPVACFPKSNTRGGASFVGPLDTLTAQGATYLFGGSVRRLLASWEGNSMRLQGNGAGTPIAAIPFTAIGDLDLTAAAAAAAAGGGTAAAGETLYDQTGRLDATQTVIANQMPFSAAVEAKGGFGNGNAFSGGSPVRLPRFKSIVAGDSGSPVCLVSGNKVILMTLLSQGGSGRGTFLASYIAPINAAMQQLGGTEQLTITP